MMNEMCKGDYPRALEYGLDAFHVDSTTREITEFLMFVYLHLRDYSTAFTYLEMSENMDQKGNGHDGLTVLRGYAYLENGMKEEADQQFQQAIRNTLLEIERNTRGAQDNDAHYVLAVTYSILGNNEKAMEYLSVLKNGETIDFGMITDLKLFPGFDAVRADPNFEAMFNDFEAKYLKLHNRVKEMLIQEGVLES